MDPTRIRLFLDLVHEFNDDPARWQDKKAAIDASLHDLDVVALDEFLSWWQPGEE